MHGIRWLMATAACACGCAFAAPAPIASTAITAAEASQPLSPAQVYKAATPTAAQVAVWGAECTPRGVPHPFFTVLDGTAAPLARRKAVLAKIEQCAQHGSISAQSFVGALYWMGDALPSALVARDPAKAITYLSNAAAHGDIPDMAKLAEIELARSRPEAAWIWAQMYGHYALQPGAQDPRQERNGFAAQLLVLVNAKLNRKQLHDATGDAVAFMAYYGADIHAYDVWRVHHDTGTHVLTSGHVHFGTHGQRPCAGLADYLVTIRPDGTVANAWGTDAFPSRRMLHLLRPIAMDTRFTPSDKPGVRFMAMLPVEYNNPRCTLQRYR